MSLTVTYLILGIAIVCEVAGTSALHASNHFTRVVPTALVFVFYFAALFGVSITFRQIPMGIVYAIWSGAGIVLIAAVGWVGFGQRLDLPAAIGLALIVAGVVIVNIFSSTLTH